MSICRSNSNQAVEEQAERVGRNSVWSQKALVKQTENAMLDAEHKEYNNLVKDMKKWQDLCTRGSECNWT